MGGGWGSAMGGVPSGAFGGPGYGLASAGMGYGGGYGGGMYGGGLPLGAQSSQAAAGGAAGAAQGTGDQTGNYLTSGGYGIISAAKIPRVIPNPFDNTLLIQATPQDYQQVLKLLQQLDVPPRQVLVEAKIYEVNMQGAFASGVQAYLQSVNAGLAAVNGTRQLQATLVPPQLTLTAGLLVGSSRQLLGILTLNEQNKSAKLVSAPSMIATDSIPARLNVGDAVPTLTGQAVGSVQTAGNSLFNQSIQNVQTGVTLSVVARVTPGGIITMKIDQQVSAPVAPAPGASLQTPSFSNRAVSTQVTVEDGDTVAIGGIILESDTLSSGGIPLLHRIPGIGAAFGAKNVTKLRTELVIFFTPHVIYDTNQITDASEEIKSRFKKLRSTMEE
jgi:general secretion pathway protein D